MLKPLLKFEENFNEWIDRGEVHIFVYILQL